MTRYSPFYSGTSRFNGPLCNEVLGMTNDFLYPSNSKVYEKMGEEYVSTHLLATT